MEWAENKTLVQKDQWELRRQPTGNRSLINSCIVVVTFKDRVAYVFAIFVENNLS